MRLLDDAQVISLIIPRTTAIDDSEIEVDEGADATADGLDSAAVTPADGVSRSSGDAGEMPQCYILTASANGFGKRTRLEEFPLRGRGGQGVIAMQTSERNGDLVSAVQVSDNDELMLITDRGTLVRTRVSEVSTTSRNTQGVTLIRTAEEERLVTTVRVDEPEEVVVVQDEQDEDALSTDEQVQAGDDAESTDTPPTDAE